LGTRDAPFAADRDDVFIFDTLQFRDHARRSVSPRIACGRAIIATTIMHVPLLYIILDDAIHSSRGAFAEEFFE